MANDSLPGLSNVPMYTMYAIQGLVIGGSQMMIVVCILRFEALRTAKEYVIVLGLSFGDAFNQMAYLCAGLHRNYLVVSGQHADLRTAWECATTPHGIIWSIGQILSTSMLALISFDRFVCVSFPLEYIGLSVKYVYCMLGVVYFYSFSNGAFSLLSTYKTRFQPPDCAASCIIVGQALSAEHTNVIFAWHFENAPIIWAATSVCMYIMVFVQYKRSTSKLHPEGNNSAFERKRQNRMTKSLGISCICTFFIFCVPYGLANWFSSKGNIRMALFFWTLSNLNPLCNLFIYLSRHKEVWQAFRALIQCKSLPTDVRMWNVNTQAAVTAKHSVQQFHTFRYDKKIEDMTEIK